MHRRVVFAFLFLSLLPTSYALHYIFEASKITIEDGVPYLNILIYAQRESPGEFTQPTIFSKVRFQVILEVDGKNVTLGTFGRYLKDETWVVKKIKVNMDRSDVMNKDIKVYILPLNFNSYEIRNNEVVLIEESKISCYGGKDTCNIELSFYAKRAIPMEFFVKSVSEKPKLRWKGWFDSEKGFKIYAIPDYWIRKKVDGVVTCYLGGKKIVDKEYLKWQVLPLHKGWNNISCTYFINKHSFESEDLWYHFLVKVYTENFYFKYDAFPRENYYFWGRYKQPVPKTVRLNRCFEETCMGRYAGRNYYYIRNYLSYSYVSQQNPGTHFHMDTLEALGYCGGSCYSCGPAFYRRGFIESYPWYKNVEYATPTKRKPRCYRVYESERSKETITTFLPPSNYVLIATNRNGSINCLYNGDPVKLKNASEPFTYYFETNNTTYLNNLTCVVGPVEGQLQYFYAVASNGTLQGAALPTLPFRPFRTFNPETHSTDDQGDKFVPAIALTVATALSSLALKYLDFRKMVWSKKYGYYYTAAVLSSSRLRSKAEKIARDRNMCVEDRRKKVNAMFAGFASWLEEKEKELLKEAQEIGIEKSDLFNELKRKVSSEFGYVQLILQQEAQVEAAEIQKVEKYKNNGAAALRIIAAELTTKAAKDLAAFYIEGWDKIEGLKKQGYAIVDQVASFEETARNRNIYASVRREIFEFLLDGGELSDEAAKFVEVGAFDGYAKELSQIVNAIKEVSKAYGIDATWVAGALQRRFDDVKGKIYDILDAEERMEEEEIGKINEVLNESGLEGLYGLIKDDGMVDLTTARAFDYWYGKVRDEEIAYVLRLEDPNEAYALRGSFLTKEANQMLEGKFGEYFKELDSMPKWKKVLYGFGMMFESIGKGIVELWKKGRAFEDSIKKDLLEHIAKEGLVGGTVSFVKEKLSAVRERLAPIGEKIRELFQRNLQEMRKDFKKYGLFAIPISVVKTQIKVGRKIVNGAINFGRKIVEGFKKDPVDFIAKALIVAGGVVATVATGGLAGAFLAASLMSAAGVGLLIAEDAYKFANARNMLELMNLAKANTDDVFWIVGGVIDAKYAWDIWKTFRFTRVLTAEKSYFELIPRKRPQEMTPKEWNRVVQELRAMDRGARGRELSWEYSYDVPLLKAIRVKYPEIENYNQVILLNRRLIKESAKQLKVPYFKMKKKALWHEAGHAYYDAGYLNLRHPYGEGGSMTVKPSTHEAVAMKFEAEVCGKDFSTMVAKASKNGYERFLNMAYTLRQFTKLKLPKFLGHVRFGGWRKLFETLIFPYLKPKK